MISAELSYRDFVPSDTIAVKFIDIDFGGDNKITRLLKDLFHLIKFEKSRKQEIKIDFLKKLQEKNNVEIEKLENRILNLKNQYKIVFLHKKACLEIKNINKEINNFLFQNRKIENEIEKLEDDRFFETSEIKRKFKNMLAVCDFSCKTSHYSNDTLISVEIYEFIGNEEEFYEKVDSKLKEFKTKLEKEINKIKDELNFNQNNEIQLEK